MSDRCILADRLGPAGCNRRNRTDQTRHCRRDDQTALWWMETFGWFLHSTGRTAEGEPYVRHGLAGLRRVLGSRNVTTAYAMARLARLTDALGNAQEAEDLLRECVDVQREILGDDHPDTLENIAALGWMRHDHGSTNTGEAESLLRQALTGQRAHPVLGDDHVKTLKTKYWLALAAGTWRNVGGGATSRGGPCRVRRSQWCQPTGRPGLPARPGRSL